MAWNSIERSQEFFRQANALHPDDDQESYNETLAHQDLLYECYMSAFSRENLEAMLTKAIAGDIKMPEEADDIDVDRYRKAYMLFAAKVLQKLNG